MDIKKAKCTECNGEFEVDKTLAITKCPHCGEEVDVVRAIRFYDSYKDSIATNKKKLIGDEYFAYMRIYDEGCFYLKNKDFDKAKASFGKCIEMNEDDYKGYMGLCAVETKNYTDVNNTSHKALLEKALQCADSDEQKDISRVYRSYFLRVNMTRDEYDVYLSERLKAEKNKVKKSILAINQLNLSKNKKAKTCFILMFCALGVGVVGITLGLIFQNLWLELIGVILFFSTYAFYRFYSTFRKDGKLYDFMVETFNFLSKSDFDAQQCIDVIGYLYRIVANIKEADPDLKKEQTIDELCEYMLSTGSQKAITFLKSQKLTAYNVE